MPEGKYNQKKVSKDDRERRKKGYRVPWGEKEPQNELTS